MPRTPPVAPEAPTSEPDLAWGELVTVLRALLGWNRDRLAAESGVSVSALSRQERGVSMPTREVRERIEGALGVRGRGGALASLLGDLRANTVHPGARSPRGPAAPAGPSRGARAAVWSCEALRLAFWRLQGLQRAPGADGDEIGAERGPALAWGELVEVLRTLAGWSQGELAARAGVSLSAITRQEHRSFKATQAARQKLAAALGLDRLPDGLATFLGELRHSMLARETAPELPAGLPSAKVAGPTVAAVTETALQLGLARMWAAEDEPPAPAPNPLPSNPSDA